MSLSTPEMSFVQTMLAVKAASQKATMDIYNTSHGRVKSSHRVKTPDALNGEMNKINE